jgi:tetratricopeptide (TPR) repeat protein
MRTGRGRLSPAPPFLHLAGAWIWCAMIFQWLRRAAAPSALSIASSAQASSADDRPGPQGANDPDALARQVEQLYQASRYLEATNIAKAALALAEKKFGFDHPAVAKALNNLATLYFVQGRDADAEPLFKSALAILKKALGPDHPEFAAARNYMAGLRMKQAEWTHAADHQQQRPVRPVTASSLGSSARNDHGSLNSGRPMGLQPLPGMSLDGAHN